MSKPNVQLMVDLHYQGLYAFALSLTCNRDEAMELVQETICKYAGEGHKIRDVSKTKSWLFTTLYHLFAGWKRRERNLPHVEISLVEEELPGLAPEMVETLDAELILTALYSLEERFRAPLVLYYLQDYSYSEIATIMEVPIGTVMSRLSRAKCLIRSALAIQESKGSAPKVLAYAQKETAKNDQS